MITAFPTFAMRLRNSPDATFFSIKIILVMMQETVKAGANKIILTTREELEGCIYAAVRTIIPELANYKSPAEEAAERFLRARCRNKTVDEALLRKLSAALQRRGFSWQDIQAPLRRLESEIQE